VIGEYQFGSALHANEAIGVSKFLLARSGAIRALQIGKVWRFRASVLDEWIVQKLAG
jgi:hypothetical protein